MSHAPWTSISDESNLLFRLEVLNKLTNKVSKFLIFYVHHECYSIFGLVINLTISHINRSGTDTANALAKLELESVNFMKYMWMWGGVRRGEGYLHGQAMEVCTLLRSLFF